MGLKRPFDDEELSKLPYKHVRKLEYDQMHNPTAGVVPCNNCPREPIFSGEGEDEDGFHKLQWHEVVEKDTITEVSNLTDKDTESSDPRSWGSSSSGEEDAGSGASAYSSLSPTYLELGLPQRRFVLFEDVYSAFLDRTPRKQVPIGADYQASIPVWNNNVYKSKLDLTGKCKPDVDDSVDDEKLMGTCVISMPDSDLSSNVVDCDGDKSADCSCPDSGSIRCVRQHVREARRKLRETIGDENFLKLGFSEMGEEVAYKWTEEEEQTFHEVVYSNPVSLGKNFWKHLSMFFPSRSKKELVSYYFNVFMLRRRAAQNRSNWLEIDSDDEWQGNNTSSYEVEDEEDDSAIESLDQDNQADLSEEDDASDADDDDSGCDDYGNDDCNGDDIEQPGREGAPREDSGMDIILDPHALKSLDESKFNPVVHPVDKVPESDPEDLNAQDDSCTSFDCEFNRASSCGPVNPGTTLQVCGAKSDHGNADWCNDAVGQFYLLEPYDDKVWNAKSQSASLKGLDLLSTWSMIEEVFGKGTVDGKRMDD